MSTTTYFTLRENAATAVAPVLHRFWDIALQMSKIAIFGYPSLVYPLAGGVPLGRSP